MVISRRERIMMIEPWDEGLLGTVLRYGYEVRASTTYFEDIPSLTIPADMQDLAEVIVQRKLGRLGSRRVQGPLRRSCGRADQIEADRAACRAAAGREATQRGQPHAGLAGKRGARAGRTTAGEGCVLTQGKGRRGSGPAYGPFQKQEASGESGQATCETRQSKEGLAAHTSASDLADLQDRQTRAKRIERHLLDIGDGAVEGLIPWRKRDLRDAQYDCAPRSTARHFVKLIIAGSPFS